MSYVEVETLPVGLLEKNAQLTHFGIFDSMLNNLPPRAFASQVNLRVLILQFNRITALSADVFLNLTSLHSLFESRFIGDYL